MGKSKNHKKKQQHHKNYSSISQRRMTQYDDGKDEEVEIQRLRTLLRESQEHLGMETTTTTPTTTIEPTTTATTTSGSSACPPKFGATVNATTAVVDGTTTEWDHHDNDHVSVVAAAASAGDPCSSSASASSELRRQGGHKRKSPEEPTTPGTISAILLAEDVVLDRSSVTGIQEDEQNPLVIVSKKKKKQLPFPTAPQRVVVALSREEVKHAKRVCKATSRKLKQLEQRAAQKAVRTELYEKLHQSSLSTAQLQLLGSSSTLGGKRTKKEQLKLLLQKERAGLRLTNDEREALYQDRVVLHARPTSDDEPSAAERIPNEKSPAPPPQCPVVFGAASPDPADGLEACNGNDTSEHGAQSTPPSAADDATRTNHSVSVPGQEPPPVSLAAQMMASLKTLKSQNDEPQSPIEAQTTPRTGNESIKPSSTRYVPSEPTVLKTAASMGLPSRPRPTPAALKVVHIARPADVQATRYDLPVSSMEFEIVDAVRNHDVTIICSETGSGKSTQVPQFLYESGFTQTDLMIGVTQPRRVAAVSTAKRVCYEMGHGNGQTITSKGASGNPVAYQTRFERAGLGTDTRIKFMTDGILLQEVQSDLLLRKYSVVVLDEAHERNLNTDVLIGLISKTIRLRREASAELALPLLKLVIMSATLRVQDFTSDGLFLDQPTVIRIPGRTFPVTIHHSKVTELDKYEDVAFGKICKIHRKLPQGGMLVFLTGKQEIVRMHRRLVKSLCKSGSPGQHRARDTTFPELVEFRQKDSPFVARELDDEEIDGNMDDAEHDVGDEDGDSEGGIDLPLSETSDVQSLEAHILPLYSLLSTADQAQVFRPPPEGHRLIVLATNLAETSITIPGITYVVDTGRHKCRNYSARTGVASYDILWISKAAADQRAGRAGRTGPGHCYRLYSSSLYARQMDEFALPEVLTCPLEDVVLSMKAMGIANISSFPLPTPLRKEELVPAMELLANLGCIEDPKASDNSHDGQITRLGAAIAKLPLGVRHGKMLLVAAQAGVLDYAVAMIASLSEQSPFLFGGNDGCAANDDLGMNNKNERGVVGKKAPHCWSHRGGDVMATVVAVGAYAYAGRGAGGVSEKLACLTFCKENGLNATVMARIHRLRLQIARLAHRRLGVAHGVAAKTGGFLSCMPPPNVFQDQLLRQVIASGQLDNVAMLAPLGSIAPCGSTYSLRTAYLSCSSTRKDPLFVEKDSALYSGDPRLLPPWVCFNSLERKVLKDGSGLTVMKRVTPVDPDWLGRVAIGSNLLHIGEPSSTPCPSYDSIQDAMLCSVTTRYGSHGWQLPPVKINMRIALCSSTKAFDCEAPYRWFARYLLEGKVLASLKPLSEMLSDDPSIITGRATSKKAVLLVSALCLAGIENRTGLIRHWANVDDKFLFRELKSWVKPDRAKDVQKLWMGVVRHLVSEWKTSASIVHAV